MKNFFLILIFTNTLFSQKNSFCNLSGDKIGVGISNYYGYCKDNNANGWGKITLKNNDTITGFFFNNKINDYYIEYYSSSSKKTIIGLNKGYKLNGPCTVYYEGTNQVSFTNYENGNWVGDSDNYFTIPQPDYKYNAEFPLKSYHSESTLNKKLNFVIFNSAKEYNQRGDRKYWLTIYDLKSNTVLKEIGSYANPISINEEPIFISFDKDNNDAYYMLLNQKSNFKYFKINLLSLIKENINTLPLEISIILGNKSKQNERSFQTTNNNTNILITTPKLNYYSLTEIGDYGKYIILKDGSYIKAYNESSYSVWGNDSSKTFNSIIIKYSKNHEILNQITLNDSFVYDFAIDEIHNRIAIGKESVNSFVLSYYDLVNFQKTSDVFNREKKNNGYVKTGKLSFSNTGNFLCSSSASGVNLFVGNKLVLNVPGSIVDFNEEDNVVICKKNNLLLAYDIEKKSLIWTIKNSSDRTMFYRLDNDLIYINQNNVTNQNYSSPSGLYSVSRIVLPKPLFSLVSFNKNIIQDIQKIDTPKITSNDRPKGSNSSSIQDAFLNELLGAIFSEALKNLMTGDSSSSSHSSSYSSSSSLNKTNTKGGVRPCSFCNREVTKPSLKNNPRCQTEYTKMTNPGYRLCTTCKGYGHKVTTGRKCDCIDGIGWCYDGECPIRSCDNGWEKCSSCNGTGQSR